MSEAKPLHWRRYDPEWLVDHCLLPIGRLLVFGEQGSGKSSLCTALAEVLAKRGTVCLSLGVDPGSPLFGIPGALSLGEYRDGDWRALRTEALCTLDAARFRLPLCQMASRLAASAKEGPLVIDAPGLTRGIAAAELLPALVEATAAEGVLVVGTGNSPPLVAELQALPCPVTAVHASLQARQLSPGIRRDRRTHLWDRHLTGTETRRFDLKRWTLVGTPPPPDVPEAWRGRQIAVLRGGATVAVGEVIGLDQGEIEARIDQQATGDALLVRNAVRGRNGSLGTALPLPGSRSEQVPGRPPEVMEEWTGPISFRTGNLKATLHNGVFGDAMLEMDFTDSPRRLVFDLGEVGRLSPRLAHRVSDVFISHAHFDHIGGFPWLLRARLLPLPPCRVFGPPGLARHIANWIGGVRWDRIGDQAPVFHIHELHDKHLECFRIVTGRSLEFVDSVETQDGLLVDEPTFRVRAITLDHGIPVLAFALEQADQFHVDRRALSDLDAAGGPWIAELKRAARHDERNTIIRLPDGRQRQAGPLADQLLHRTPGERFVYATDFADSAANRTRLVKLARGADTLMCEATFLASEADQARNTQHLTAGACGEIGAQAGVRQLVPFHFSRRYQSDPAEVYREVEAGFGGDIERQTPAEQTG